jgi:adenylate cyclase
VIPLGIQAPIGLVGAVALRYREAKREREILRKTFGYFLPNRVVDQLAANMGPILAQDQLVYGTCLATDAERFTAFAEPIAPQELGRLMNEYYAVLFAPVEQHGGMVSDVLGDAMLAVWAASRPDADLRKGACEAALDIVRALGAPHGVSARAALRTRIGLHSGQMALGTIGAGKHFEYRAVGDIVNTANRIQELNKVLGTRLLASEAVLENVKGFCVRPLGDFLLSGKSIPVTALELLSREDQASHEIKWLCTAFGEALNCYQRQDWQQASERFAEIQQRFPDDGPSRFYLARCQAHREEPPTEAWDAVVRVPG